MAGNGLFLPVHLGARRHKSPIDAVRIRQIKSTTEGHFAMNTTQAIFGLNVDPVDALMARATTRPCSLLSPVSRDHPIVRWAPTMAVFADGQRVGTLSSGCIENDIALHALRTLETGRPAAVRYGVWLRRSWTSGFPVAAGSISCCCRVRIGAYSGSLRSSEHGASPAPCASCVTTVRCRCTMKARPVGMGRFSVCVSSIPEIRFIVLGKGPEAGSSLRLCSRLVIRACCFLPTPRTVSITLRRSAARCGI